MIKFNFLKFIFVLFIGFFAFPSFAQNVLESVNLSISPSNPKASQPMSASVSSLNSDINLANISWSLDGKVMKSGKGEKMFSFNAPIYGKSQVLKVLIGLANGEKIEKTQTIRPEGDVDLIFESIDGYAPPFYRGKILPIKQARIKVSAIPNIKDSKGVNIPTSNFVYNWTKNGQKQTAQSGLGKNSFVFANQVLDTENTISVSVNDGERSASASARIAFFEPEIIFYEYDSLKSFPRYEKAITEDIKINQPRITLVAEPYFLMKDWRSNKEVTMNWSLNNQSAKAGDKNTVGIITGTKGPINVSFEYNETQKLFRKFTETLKLNVE